MALYLTHVNTLLAKLRQTPVTALSTDTTSEAYRAQEAVNRAIARVWNANTWSFKRRKSELTTVNGTGEYPLPKDVGEPFSVVSSLYPYKIHPIAQHLFDLYVPNIQHSGNPRWMILSEMVGVSAQPSAAAVVSIVSSNAADLTQTVLVKGIVSGQEDYEAVALNGSTTVSTTKSFSSILSLTKSAATLGRLTFTSGATTLFVMAPQELVSRLRKARLYPTPASALTVTIWHFALPPILTNAYEDTLVPSRWDYVIDQWAFVLGLQAKGQDQTPEFQTQLALAESMLKEDMKSEEVISVEEPVVPLKAGEGGYANQLFAPPSGTNFVEGI